MSGFSPEWLALREPVDHRSRDAALAAKLEAHFRSRPSVSVIDLGCGAGSNIRATYAQLPSHQDWTLVDYDPRLLAVARERLLAWGDDAKATGDAIELRKSGKQLRVRFRQSDLNADLAGGIGGGADLITAAALFDLCSEPFIERFAHTASDCCDAFYTVLTYNGVQTWTPPHAADARLAAAFHAHQRTDKGFGASAGPDAPSTLRSAFLAAGMTVDEGDSPWLLTSTDRALIAELAQGFADAVAETARVPPNLITEWRAVPRTEAVVGHTDTLALQRS